MLDGVIVFILTIVFALGLIVGLSLGGTSDYNRGYRDGQIDAQSGKIVFCLETQPDLSKIWEKCDE